MTEDEYRFDEVEREDRREIRIVMPRVSYDEPVVSKLEGLEAHRQIIVFVMATAAGLCKDRGAPELEQVLMDLTYKTLDVIEENYRQMHEKEVS